MTADIIITVVLSSLGILLVLAEVFLLPGFTITGILGALFGGGSVYYAYAYLGPVGGTITLILTLFIFSALFIWVVKSKAINKIGLTTNSDSKVDTDVDLINEGDEGVALSRLNPIGKVKINNITIEGKSLTDWVDEGQQVVVVKKSSNQVVVKIKS